MTKVVIAGGSILLAAVIGIVGAVVAGPVPRGASPSAAPPSGAVTGRVVQGLFCLDASAGGADGGGAGAGGADGSGAGTTPVRLDRCGAADGELWTFAPDGTVRALGKCMRPTGATVQLVACDGSPSQQWLHGPDGSLAHRASGACLEAAGSDSAPRLAACADRPGQRWELR